jgi:cytochrome b561
MPVLLGENHGLHEILEEVHGFLAFSILALVGLHVAGVIKHRLIEQDPEADVLKRML